MTSSEQKVFISLQEGLAVVYTMKQFISYLKFTKVILITDHQALKYLLESVEPRGMFARWIAYLPLLILLYNTGLGKI